MALDKEELLELTGKYQAKADRDYQAYQEIGESRYYSSYRRNEDLADALRMAANAADEHQAYILMRGDMADFARHALETSRAAGRDRDELIDALITGLITYGRLKDLLWCEREETEND